jgi:hypothetical protein
MKRNYDEHIHADHLDTCTIEVNIADIGFRFVDGYGDAFNTGKNKDVARDHRWLVDYLPPNININPAHIKSIEFPKLDYNHPSLAANVKLTYYKEWPDSFPNHTGWPLDADGPAILEFGQFSIEFMDGNGKTLKRGDGHATLNRWLVKGPVDTMMVRSVTLPTLDYSSSKICTFRIEYYMGNKEWCTPTEMVEADLSICPSCGGPADNGWSRDVPPAPYVCKRCTMEHDTHLERQLNGWR